MGSSRIWSDDVCLLKIKEYTQEYHEGETIVPLECLGGVEWSDDLPEVMPPRNLVIVGVEADS